MPEECPALTIGKAQEHAAGGGAIILTSSAIDGNSGTFRCVGQGIVDSKQTDIATGAASSGDAPWAYYADT